MIRGLWAVLGTVLIGALTTAQLKASGHSIFFEDFRDLLSDSEGADAPTGQPPDEPPAQPIPLLTFKAASDQPPFPSFATFSAGLAPGVWLDWSASAKSKNRPVERLSLAAGKAVWLPNLAGDDKPLIVKFRQGSRELDAASLALDLRPDFVLEHPLGLYVLAQGFLFQFQTADAQSPWGMKKCLVRRIDRNSESLAGSLRLARDGSLWLLLTGGPATLAGMDGRPLQVPPGDTLWKIDAEGRFLELRAQGSAGALGQLVSGPNGSFFLKIAKNDPGTSDARQGYRPLSSFEFLKTLLPPAANYTGLDQPNRELIVLLPGKDERPEQFLLLEAQVKTARILQQKLDLESSILFPAGEKQNLTQGLTQAGLLALSDGSVALFGMQQQGQSVQRPWVLGGFAIDSATKAPGADPGPSVTKLGPGALAKMIASPHPAEAWRAWAEARSRIDKRLNALNPTPPPLMAELRKLAQADEIDEITLSKIVSLLEACGDAESLKMIQNLAEEGATAIRVQCLEALGRMASAQDQAIYQTMLNGMADPEPLIKAASALGLARARFAGSANALATALSFDNEPEGDWPNTLSYALRLLGTPGHDRVWQLAQSGQGADLDKAVNYFAATSEKAAANFILQLLDYPHLASPQRRLLLKALRPEGDENLGQIIGKRIGKQNEVAIEELALWWEKAEDTSWAGSIAARDRLLELLAAKSEDERWFALGKLKKRSFFGTAERLEKGRSSFPLTGPQQRALDEAILFQKTPTKPNQ